MDAKGAREILFRGKRIDNGEWVEGNIFIPDKLTNREPPTEILVGTNVVRISYEVDPETVGQYTGLTDKNGKKIFEGDIVKTDKFSEPNKQYIIKYDLQFGAFIGQDRYNLYFVTFDGDSGEFEVIGNIHDNPELLKRFNKGV